MALNNKKQVRRIVVDGTPYIWKFNENARYQRNTFRAYVADKRTHALSIDFSDVYCSSGTPYVAGEAEASGVNLFTPVWAATSFDMHCRTAGIHSREGLHSKLADRF